MELYKYRLAELQQMDGKQLSEIIEARHYPPPQTNSIDSKINRIIRSQTLDTMTFERKAPSVLRQSQNIPLPTPVPIQIPARQIPTVVPPRALSPTRASALVPPRVLSPRASALVPPRVLSPRASALVPPRVLSPPTRTSPPRASAMVPQVVPPTRTSPPRGFTVPSGATVIAPSKVYSTELKSPPKRLSPGKTVSEKKIEMCGICGENEVKEEDLLSCGHAVCVECLSKLEQPFCPFDRKPLAGNLMTPDIMDSILERIQHTEDVNKERDAYVADIVARFPEVRPEELYTMDLAELKRTYGPPPEQLFADEQYGNGAGGFQAVPEQKDLANAWQEYKEGMQYAQEGLFNYAYAGVGEDEFLLQQQYEQKQNAIPEDFLPDTLKTQLLDFHLSGILEDEILVDLFRNLRDTMYPNLKIGQFKEAVQLYISQNI